MDCIIERNTDLSLRFFLPHMSFTTTTWLNPNASIKKGLSIPLGKFNVFLTLRHIPRLLNFRIFSFAEWKAHIVPLTLETNYWIQEGQTGTSKDDHDTFHNHEKPLIINKECAIESTRELDTSINASSENSHGCDN